MWLDEAFVSKTLAFLLQFLGIKVILKLPFHSWAVGRVSKYQARSSCACQSKSQVTTSVVTGLFWWKVCDLMGCFVVGASATHPGQSATHLLWGRKLFQGRPYGLPWWLEVLSHLLHRLHGCNQVVVLHGHHRLYHTHGNKTQGSTFWLAFSQTLILSIKIIVWMNIWFWRSGTIFTLLWVRHV